MSPPIPITILTGFLGSGKTTLLLSLLPQLPASYKLCLLKNEFGNVEVDSRLAAQGSVGVKELLNGCICCNLVGQLGDALLELKKDYKPDRIVIETSGSAFPATLAMEVNRIGRETNGGFVLDGVVMVVDVENWKGYEDTSYTAKLQANYTDLIVFNKWESVGPRREDEVMDRVRDLGDTAVVKSDRGWISKDIVFGIDGGLARDLTDSGPSSPAAEKKQFIHHIHNYNPYNGHQSEVEVLNITLPEHPSRSDGSYIDIAALNKLLIAAPRDEVYRIKGIFRSRTEPILPPDHASPTPLPPSTSYRYILNWAFGRWTYTPLYEPSVSTFIEAPEFDHNCDPPTCPPSPTTEMAEMMSSGTQTLETRPASIKIAVETSIRTVVNNRDDPVDGQDVGRFTVVLARGETTRWKGKLEKGCWIRYDGDSDSGNNLRVEKVL